VAKQINTFPFVGTRLEIFTSLWCFTLPRLNHFRWTIHRNLLLQFVDIIIQQKKFNTLKILVNFEMLIIEHVFLKQIFVCALCHPERSEGSLR
jgi:hypothetical protein